MTSSARLGSKRVSRRRLKPARPDLRRKTGLAATARVKTDPIFVIGSPRSGTSVLTWCLGQHPNILPLEESSWFPTLATSLQTCYEIGSARNERSQLSAMKISREELMRIIGATVNGFITSKRLAYEAACDSTEESGPFRPARSADDPKQRWVDGTPEYSMHVFALRQLFPTSKFIHIVRQVADVVPSLLILSRRNNLNLANSEQEAYEYWLRTVSASAQAERAFGSRVVLRVRYQDLIGKPKKTLTKCLTFVGETFHPDCQAPLATRINSSEVPVGWEPSDARTDLEVKVRAETLSAELLSEPLPKYPGSTELTKELEAKFVQNARFRAWANDELVRRLAAERKAAQPA